MHGNLMPQNEKAKDDKRYSARITAVTIAPMTTHESGDEAVTLAVLARYSGPRVGTTDASNMRRRWASTAMCVETLSNIAFPVARRAESDDPLTVEEVAADKVEEEAARTDTED